MELRGILLDVHRLEVLGKEIDRKLTAIAQKIKATLQELCGDAHEQINLNSPKQVEVLLFDTLALPVVKKSKEGARSTDAEVLTELALAHPIPAMILEYRELFKLKSTYVEPLPKEINVRTGRIHTTFNQTDVATGRLSSAQPNLQNIPVVSSYGRQIREAFIPTEGYVFLSADYSQIDLRVLAYMSQDTNLMQAFIDGRDVHAQTAADIFGLALDQVSHAQRQVGKRINFSIIYGLTPYGLSRDLHISLREAKQYIDAYFARYPGVGKWMDEVVATGVEKGYVETAFGRRRYIPQLREKNRTIFDAARRIAINTPVQGTAAELIKYAMLAIDYTCSYEQMSAHILLQIHDELLIEVKEDQHLQVAQRMQTTMESVVDWNVPLVVSLSHGSNWAAVTK